MDMNFFDEAMNAVGIKPIYIGFEEPIPNCPRCNGERELNGSGGYSCYFCGLEEPQEHKHMKTYTIHRTGKERELGEVTVIVIDENKTSRLLTPEASLKIRNHSPTGFEFGYGGSGPTQLALAIMLDYFGEGPSLALYHAFKWKFISPLAHPGGTITAAEIEKWKAEFDAGAKYE